MEESTQKASVTAERILRIYNHPKMSGHRFRDLSQCPVCSCEHVYVLAEEGDNRMFMCQCCFSTHRVEAQAA